jgi:hypothetical protein
MTAPTEIPIIVETGPEMFPEPRNEVTDEVIAALQSGKAISTPIRRADTKTGRSSRLRVYSPTNLEGMDSRPSLTKRLFENKLRLEHFPDQAKDSPSERDAKHQRQDGCDNANSEKLCDEGVKPICVKR